MSVLNRVFVTGTSALSACGLTANENWDAVLSGRVATGELSAMADLSWEYRLGGEIKGYQPAQRLPDRKLIKVISRHDVMGIDAAIGAVADSQIIDYRDSLNDPSTYNQDTAIYVGSPGNKYSQQYDFLPLMAKARHDFSQFGEHLLSEVHPMWLLRILPNNVLAYTGITYGFKGENHNIVNHAASGMQAILEAYHAIRHGRASRAVVVAYDIPIELQGLFYYEHLGVLSPRHLRPFDKQHDGTLLAEGAAALVLESEFSVNERGARPWAEIVSGQLATEGSGLFSVNQSGESLGALLQAAVATRPVSDFGFVVAHGNGNPASDVSEARAILQWSQGDVVPVTAFKWAMGHTVCASGLMDTVLAVRALRQRCVPGIATLQHLASECDGLDASNTTRPMLRGEHALLINRGFGGINVALVMKACA